MKPKGFPRTILLFVAVFGVLALELFWIGSWLFQSHGTVRDLSAQIEYFGTGGTEDAILLIRLKNEGGRPVLLPIDTIEDPKVPAKDLCFELQARSLDSPWEHLRWLHRINADGNAPANYPRGFVRDNPCALENGPDLPLTQLAPRKDAVLCLDGGYAPLPESATEIRVALSSPQSSASTIVTSPPFPAGTSRNQHQKRNQTLDFPDSFPAFSRILFEGGNLSGWEPAVVRLMISNGELLESLGLYKPDKLRVELERRLSAEKSPFMKLMLAGEAAPLGSDQARQFLIEDTRSTDYDTLESLSLTFSTLIPRYHENIPRWLIDLALAVEKDARNVVASQNSGYPPGTRVQVREVCGLIDALARAKCREMAPILIDRIEHNRDNTNAAASELAILNDARAVPVLLEFLKRTAKNAGEKEYDTQEVSTSVAAALCRLHAKEATPIFLQHLAIPEVIELVDSMGDPNAIPALHQLIEANGQVIRDGKPFRKQDEKKRLIAAKIALADLDHQNRCQNLCALLSDPSFENEFDRRSIVWRLGHKPEVAAVPILLQLVRNDPSGVVVNQTITVLGEYKDPVVVSGLIDCLDADFTNKADWKRTYEPTMFRKNINETLNRITGQNLVPDKQVWRDWWEKEGQRLEWMKTPPK